MKIQQVLNCSFPAWYRVFKRDTFKSEIIPIPKEVVDYLLTDGVILPKSAQNGCPSQTTSHGAEYDSDSEDGIAWDDDDLADNDKIPSFPVFEEKVQKAIAKLGGKVFPKLNWSAPKDATWVALNNSLMCTNPGDIFLLLKSSDFITRDLTQPFIYCDNGSESEEVAYNLVLRRWSDITPSGEFRCFVKNNEVMAVSQRSHTTHFSHIEGQKEEIIKDIVDFHELRIKGKFVDHAYVFDVYRQDLSNVKLVDFNPFGEVTDPLLYSWSELKQFSSDTTSEKLPDFRHQYVERGVQPTEYQTYGLPKDVIDLCHGVDVNKLIDVMRLREHIGGSSSDEE